MNADACSAFAPGPLHMCSDVDIWDSSAISENDPFTRMIAEDHIGHDCSSHLSKDRTRGQRADPSRPCTTDIAVRGVPGDGNNWAMDSPMGVGPSSISSFRELAISEEHESRHHFTAATASLGQGSISAFSSHQSQASLPVSSDSSDVTDSSVCTSDDSPFVSLPLSSSGVLAPVGGFPCVRAPSASAMDDGIFASGESWDANLVHTSSGPLSFDLAMRGRQTLPIDGNLEAGLNSATSVPESKGIVGEPSSMPGDVAWSLSSGSLPQGHSTSVLGEDARRDMGVTRLSAFDGQSDYMPNISMAVQDPRAAFGVVPGHDGVLSVQPGQVMHSDTLTSSHGLPLDREEFRRTESDGSPSPPRQQDTEDGVFPLSPTAVSMGRRLSDETDLSVARSNPLYQVGPREDGLYHCPFESKGCNHKPENLKCNYHKHIDSHLRPYRCKIISCSKQQFSSTACLLRHEREAHGMHGHGEKPFACPFEGCERSEPGNGFPRKWNLADHMKRVHNSSSPVSANSSGSSAAVSTIHGTVDSHTSSKRKAAISKRPKPRRNSKNMAIAISRTGSKSAYTPPAGSLPEHGPFFGLNRGVAGSAFQAGCAPMMQASRSMSDVDQFQPYSDSLGDFEVDSFCFDSTFFDPRMEFPSTLGHEPSNFSYNWSPPMEHTCVSQLSPHELGLGWPVSAEVQ